MPFICTRFEWQLQRQLRRHPALGLTPEETDRGVHFVQDSRFFKPLRPGMNVEAKGRISSVRAVRAGALIAYDYTLEDADARELLSASRSVSIFRDVAVAAVASEAQQHEQRDADQARAFPARPPLPAKGGERERTEFAARADSTSDYAPLRSTPPRAARRSVWASSRL